MKNIFIKLGLVVANTNQQTMNAFNPLGHFLKFLISGVKSDGLMSAYKQDKIFSSSNKGLVLNGYDKRLTPKESFNHLALISRTGGGKTTSYVIPNIFKLAQDKNSLVITDISGELYNQTSGFLKSQGYKIYVLNPENLNESIGYNPLFYANDSMKIDELVSILLKSNKESNSTNAENEYWDN
jgi:type IV secretory pathway TraG/TraD family ATPase VirD4